MTTLLILMAYIFDYRADKKNFVTDCKGGLTFVLLLVITYVLTKYVFNLGSIIACLSVGLAIPFVVFIQYFFKKK